MSGLVFLLKFMLKWLLKHEPLGAQYDRIHWVPETKSFDNWKVHLLPNLWAHHQICPKSIKQVHILGEGFL
jgi:hypothetical protein